ncbi:MAG: N-acetylmuramoyl-L-alanine amidase [Clostridiales bacterium]|jgi:N-acetylmuramoyl-L-alanine amidase|nr:N-acetylmuramoyl-L-alanine amidase [Clostridiales bacterium]
MKITDALLTMGASHGRTGKAINPKGIVVHYVANPGSSAISNRNYFENGSNGRGVSSHYIVGLQGEIIRCIPETEVAMHAGAAYSSAYLEQAKVNNSIYYGIETCHPNADGKFSDITNLSLIELCADMCVHHGFDPHKKLFTHNEVTGKLCPLYYVNHPEEWLKFKDDVQDMLSKTTLPSGYVNLAVGNKNYEIEAVNINGRFYSTLDNLTKVLDGKKIVSIRDVLEANGYTVTWNESLQRITAVMNNSKAFSQMDVNF